MTVKSRQAGMLTKDAQGTLLKGREKRKSGPADEEECWTGHGSGMYEFHSICGCLHKIKPVRIDEEGVLQA